MGEVVVGGGWSQRVMWRILVGGVQPAQGHTAGRRPEESTPYSLKLSIQKGKIMAYGLISLDGEKVEIVTDFFGGAPKSLWTDCSHEIKRHLLLGKKTETNLDSILKAKTSLC